MQKGIFADLVLLDANSLTDIGNTQKIAAMVFNRKIFFAGGAGESGGGGEIGEGAGEAAERSGVLARNGLAAGG